MKILLLNQAFFPDVVATAQQASDLAKALAAEGHSVTIVASQRAYASPGILFSKNEVWCGCTIKRLSVSGFGTRSKCRRIIDAAVLLAGYLYQLVRLPAFDVVIAMTHPPMVAVLAAVVVRLKGGRLVSWVMDLNPDEAIAAGWISPRSPIARVLKRALKFALKASSNIIVLDRFMQARLVAKGVPSRVLKIIPPWSNDEHVQYDPVGRVRFRAAHGLTDKFVVMYSGNVSIVHPMDTLLMAATELKCRPDIVFCFVGGGNGLASVKEIERRHDLQNVVCLPYQSLDDLGASLSAADVQVVVMGTSMVGIVHPCKIYNLMIIGKPIIHIGPRANHIGDIMESLTTDGGAYHAEQGDVRAVVNAISDAADRRLERVEELQVTGLRFSQAVLIPKVVQIVDDVVLDGTPAINAARAYLQ